jgi:hypothetical protein
MRIAPLAALTAVLLGTAAAPALAAKPATTAQTRSMARAIQGIPRCYEGVVSTTDRAWGKLTPVVNDDEACLNASSVIVLHRTAPGKWNPVLQTGTDPHATCVDVKGRVPNRIVRELKVCKLA